MQSLLDKKQCLLSEDIQVAVYNMANVNFDHFFSTFLPQFIRGIEGVTDQQREILLNTFVQNYDKVFVSNSNFGFIKNFVSGYAYFCSSFANFCE